MNNSKNSLTSLKKVVSKFSLNISPNHKYLKEYKMTLKDLPKTQWEASIGLMLGDVSIQIQNEGRRHRLKFEWRDNNKFYAKHVYSLFNVWVLSPSRLKKHEWI